MASETQHRPLASHLDTRLASPTLPVVLRTIEPRDAPAFSALLSHPSNGADPNARPLDVAKAADIIARQRESASVPSVLGADGRVASGPSRVNMVVVLATDQGEETVIGLGGFGAIKDWQRQGRGIRAGDAGVMIDPAHRGKGFAAEAMRLAIGWAFTPVAAGGPQLDLVTVTTLADNAPMLRLADERLGLRGMGVLREAEGGEPAGEMYYEVTPEAWQRLSA